MATVRTSSWRRGLAVGAALALPLSVAACGDDETDDPDIVDEEGATPTDVPGETEQDTEMGTEDGLGPETPAPGTDQGGTDLPGEEVPQENLGDEPDDQG